VRAQPLSLAQLIRQALRTLGAAYQDMRDTLAGRNHVADYVQTLTHEVKSPLSAIRGAAELLQEPMPDEDRARFAGNIARETQRIQELVDRMMELTVLESRHHLREPAPVALRALLEELAQRSQAAGAPRSIQVQVESPTPPATVHGDAFLLRRALSNLVDNALDFSPEGGVVTLSLRLKRRQAEITVRDHGPGIPDYAGEKVFEKFYSLARPHSKKRSTGLGLSFVKEIVTLHHGTVSLSNAPGGGALATLCLPLTEGPHGEG
jgi:two-component system sensor histidine kinase CreC